jgi:hypothetical protein
MTESHESRAAHVLVDAGWSRLWSRLVAGVCRDLHGGVDSLGGLIKLLRMSEGPETADGVGPFLEKEMERIESSVRLLELLPGDLSDPVKTLRPGEVFPPLVALHRRDPEATGDTQVALESDAPPFRAAFGRFARTFLVILAHAEDEAHRRGWGPLTVAAMGREDELRVRIAAEGSEDGAAGGANGTGPDGDGIREALAILVGYEEAYLAWDPAPGVLATLDLPGTGGGSPD